MMMLLEFKKYHGTGNDFVLLGPEIRPEEISTENIRRISERHFGVGADGVLFVCQSEKADFMMRMFNPDGGEAEMCGNGIRCFAKYLRDCDHSDKDEILIESKTGLHLCRLFFGPDGKVSDVEVGMGKPDLARSSVGMEGEGDFIGREIASGEYSFKGTAVSMGNPHLVIFSSRSVEEAERIGPLFESHPLFPQKTNVEFVDQIGDQHLSLVVYERGAGITLACGTGACASFAAAAAENLINPDLPVRIDLPGGTLTIRRDLITREIWMRGPAVHVFEGKLEL